MTTRYCTKCGAEMSSAAIFCSSCGEQQAATQPATADTPKASPSKAAPIAIGCAIAAGIAFFALPVVGILAAIAIPAFVQYRNDTRSGLCQNNLRLIEHAKSVNAVKNDLASGDEIEPDKVNEYIKGGAPLCPDGGTYIYNVIDTDAECDHGEDHTL
jgi:hypothetical protein